MDPRKIINSEAGESCGKADIQKFAKEGGDKFPWNVSKKKFG